MDEVLIEKTIQSDTKEELSNLVDDVENFQPYVIKNVLLLSPGKWNGKNFSAESIKNGFQNTDWADKSNYALIYSHDEKAENWVGNAINRYVTDEGKLYADLEIFDKALAIKLGKGKAKLGISAKIFGNYDEETNDFSIDTFNNFSVVYNPACKEAFINLSQDEKNGILIKLSEDFKKMSQTYEILADGGVTDSSTSSGNPVDSNVNRPVDYGKADKKKKKNKKKDGNDKEPDTDVDDSDGNDMEPDMDPDDMMMSEESLARVTDMETKRKQMGMSVSQFYAVPRNPPSASKLPIFDAAHVRNAAARFNQIKGVSPVEKKRALSKIRSAAKKFGIKTELSEELAKVTDMEGMRKRMGMSISQFYAIPMNPPSMSKLPIFDAAHVRNALARINQVMGVSAAQKKSAMDKIMRAAKKFGIKVNTSKKGENMEEKMENDEVEKTVPQSEELDSKISSILDSKMVDLLDAVTNLSERLDALESNEESSEEPQEDVAEESAESESEEASNDSKESAEEPKEPQENLSDEESSESESDEESANEDEDEKEKLSESESSNVETLSEQVKSLKDELAMLKSNKAEASPKTTVELSREDLGRGAANLNDLEMNLLNTLNKQIQ